MKDTTAFLLLNKPSVTPEPYRLWALLNLEYKKVFNESLDLISLNFDSSVVYNIALYEVRLNKMTGELRAICEKLIASLKAYYVQTWGFVWGKEDIKASLLN
uniref:Uncharacterized protein n=1 Tax=Vibrio crassostreae TaxID=246167 RepID=A0A0H3ZPM6_9VIBR|nr:hypothetical protein [Vibrio crassostreae]